RRTVRRPLPSARKSRRIRVPIPLADAEIEPPPGEEIKGCRLLRQQHRIVPGQHDHRRSEAQRSGACAEPSQQVERRRDLAVAGKMVLDDKGAVKAERLGLDVVLDEIAKSLAAIEFGTVTWRMPMLTASVSSAATGICH